eukprot:SAG31_NODE_5859_length_2285_cov_3.783166_4_plen_63_part_00
MRFANLMPGHAPRWQLVRSRPQQLQQQQLQRRAYAGGEAEAGSKQAEEARKIRQFIKVFIPN